MQSDGFIYFPCRLCGFGTEVDSWLWQPESAPESARRGMVRTVNMRQQGIAVAKVIHHCGIHKQALHSGNKNITGPSTAVAQACV